MALRIHTCLACRRVAHTDLVEAEKPLPKDCPCCGETLITVEDVLAMKQELADLRQRVHELEWAAECSVPDREGM